MGKSANQAEGRKLMTEDRIVIYRAVPETDDDFSGPVDGAEMRVRTYGGRIPYDLDVQYRQNVAGQIEANGLKVAEVAVADLPMFAQEHSASGFGWVHGFYDARTCESGAMRDGKEPVRG